MRNPRRTAQTAAALMIGLALVSTIAVLGASLSTSAAQQRRQRGQRRLHRHRLGRLQQLGHPPPSPACPGCRTATTVYQGQFEFRGALSTSPRRPRPTWLEDRQPARHRRQRRCGDGGRPAADRHQHGERGSSPRRLGGRGQASPRPGPTTMRIGGIFKPNPLVGSFVVGARVLPLALQQSAAQRRCCCSTAPGARIARQALNRVLRPYAERRRPRRGRSSSSAQKNTVNQELGLVYVLLALADRWSR